MEKRKRIEGETQLPEEIIQHIQSFLGGKEAARTTIFSKSWYEAWLTRPNLDFSRLDFRGDKAFMNFGTKTMQRYEELNRKIQSFKLRIDGCWSPDTISPVEWTKKAIKLGVADLHIHITPNNFINFVLPREVLESETLVKLFLSGSCKIDLHNQKVSCSRLKSLRLLYASIEGNNNIWDLITMCPLIEELLISTWGCKSVFNPGLDKNIFHKLKVLSLEGMEIGELFFHDLSSKFPYLKELTFQPITSHREIQIYSNSLESVYCKSFHDYKMMWSAKFDVPRIKKFKFFGCGLPSLSFKTTSTEWESNISINCTWEISCVAELRKFLQELSPSKIYLNLEIIRWWDEYGDFIYIPKPLSVEKLTIQLSSPFVVQSAVLEDLFWICRPNFLVLEFPAYSMSRPLYTNTSGLMKLLCSIPIEEGKENRNMSDLEEVKFDFFRKYGGEWLPLSCKTLIEASSFSKGRLSILACLQLKWGKSV